MCVMPSSLRLSPEYAQSGEYSILFEVSSTSSNPLFVYESAFLKFGNNRGRMVFRNGPLSMSLETPRAD